MNIMMLKSLGTCRIHVIEAYTGKHLSYRTGIDGLDPNRFAEIRFRADEMPTIYYETDHALEMVRTNSPLLPCNQSRPSAPTV